MTNAERQAGEIRESQTRSTLSQFRSFGLLGGRTPKDVYLVAQGDDLNLELMPRSQTENDGREQEAEHESRGDQLNPASAMFSIGMEFSVSTIEQQARAT